MPAASACRARSSRCGRFEAQLFFLSLVTRSAVIWATTRAERGESTWHPATGGRAPVTCTKPSIYAIRLTGPGVRRATSSKPSAARPLANIVHRLNEPAFTLENRIYRWQQLVDAHSAMAASLPQARDRGAHGAVSFELAAVGLTSAFLPARKAASIEPMQALRED